MAPRVPRQLRGHIAHRLDRDLRQYVINDETVVVAVRQHWMAHIKPFGTSLLLLAAAVLVDLKAPATPGGAILVQLLWGAWLVSLLWVGWVVLNWRRDWFVATDKRFLMFYGFIHRRVDMMPLTKVTDLSFNRSILGRILGYGDFTLESAGQHQSLSHIGFLRHADEHYRTICQVLFSEQNDDDRPARRHEDWDDHHDSTDDFRDGDAPDDEPDGWVEDDSRPRREVSGDGHRRTAYPVETSPDAYAARDARAFGMPVAAPPGRRRRDRSPAEEDDARLRESWSAWEATGASSLAAEQRSSTGGEYVYRSEHRVEAARRADTDEIPILAARPLPPRARRRTERTEELHFPPKDWFD